MKVYLANSVLELVRYLMFYIKVFERVRSSVDELDDSHYYDLK